MGRIISQVSCISSAYICIILFRCLHYQELSQSLDLNSPDHVTLLLAYNGQDYHAPALLVETAVTSLPPSTAAPPAAKATPSSAVSPVERGASDTDSGIQSNYSSDGKEDDVERPKMAAPTTGLTPPMAALLPTDLNASQLEVGVLLPGAFDPSAFSPRCTTRRATPPCTNCTGAPRTRRTWRPRRRCVCARSAT